MFFSFATNVSNNLGQVTRTHGEVITRQNEEEFPLLIKGEEKYSSQMLSKLGAVSQRRGRLIGEFAANG